MSRPAIFKRSKLRFRVLDHRSTKFNPILMQMLCVNSTFYNSLRVAWASCHRALRRFHHDPELTISRLQGLNRLSGSPECVAQFLFNGHGKLSAKHVGHFLTSPPQHVDVTRSIDTSISDVAHPEVLHAYVAQFDFANKSLPEALRLLLARTRMPSRTKG